MKLLKLIKQYLINIVIESIEEYSVCKWHFKGDEKLTEEDIQNLLKRIDEEIK